jgi:hypothetical protein
MAVSVLVAVPQAVAVVSVLVVAEDSANKNF